jgi:two-component system sensor histidine kinase TctE
MRPANDPKNKRPSIRRRLFALLLIPTAAIAAAATYGAYRTALAPFEAAYDKALLDAALAIASNIEARDASGPTLSLTRDAVSVLRSDSLDTIYDRVSGDDGHFIAGDRELPVPHQGVENPEFDDLTFGREPIRVVSYRVSSAHGGSIVTVAETRHKRNNARASVPLLARGGRRAARHRADRHLAWRGIRHRAAAQRGAPAFGARIAGPRTAHTDGVPVEIRSLIDALKRLFGALQEAEIAERSFLDNAAHQLRTPLAGMLAHLELMAAGGAAIDGAQAQAALEGARRLARTTQQLLALARSDAASRSESLQEEISLPEVIKVCVKRGSHRPTPAASTRCGLLNLRFTRGSAWMLEEALGNLTDNAIAATPTGAA